MHIENMTSFDVRLSTRPGHSDLQMAKSRSAKQVTCPLSILNQTWSYLVSNQAVDTPLVLAVTNLFYQPLKTVR